MKAKSATTDLADAYLPSRQGEGSTMHRWLNLVLLLLCIVSWLILIQFKRGEPLRERKTTEKLMQSISLTEPIAVSRINADGSRAPLFPSLIGMTMNAKTWSIFERMTEFRSEIMGFQMSEAGKGARQEPKPAKWLPIGEASTGSADQTISIYQTEDGRLGFGRHGFFWKSFRGPESPLAAYVIKGMSNE